MPTTKSAVKRMRTSEKRRLRNVSFKSKLKTHKKKLLGLIEAGQKDEAVEFFKTVTSLYDRELKKGLLNLIMLRGISRGWQRRSIE